MPGSILTSNSYFKASGSLFYASMVPNFVVEPGTFPAVIRRFDDTFSTEYDSANAPSCSHSHPIVALIGGTNSTADQGYCLAVGYDSSNDEYYYDTFAYTISTGNWSAADTKTAMSAGYFGPGWSGRSPYQNKPFFYRSTYSPPGWLLSGQCEEQRIMGGGYSISGFYWRDAGGSSYSFGTHADYINVEDQVIWTNWGSATTVDTKGSSIDASVSRYLSGGNYVHSYRPDAGPSGWVRANTAVYLDSNQNLRAQVDPLGPDNYSQKTLRIFNAVTGGTIETSLIPFPSGFDQMTVAPRPHADETYSWSHICVFCTWRNSTSGDVAHGFVLFERATSTWGDVIICEQTGDSEFTPFWGFVIFNSVSVTGGGLTWTAGAVHSFVYVSDTQHSISAGSFSGTIPSSSHEMDFALTAPSPALSLTFAQNLADHNATFNLTAPVPAFALSFTNKKPTRWGGSDLAQDTYPILITGDFVSHLLEVETPTPGTFLQVPMISYTVRHRSGSLLNYPEAHETSVDVVAPRQYADQLKSFVGGTLRIYQKGVYAGSGIDVEVCSVTFERMREEKDRCYLHGSIVVAYPYSPNSVTEIEDSSVVFYAGTQARCTPKPTLRPGTSVKIHGHKQFVAGVTFYVRADSSLMELILDG